MNKRQLMAAFNKGFLDEVAKDLLRYGNIQQDWEWEDDQGLHREQEIKRHDLLWTVHKKNGEVVGLGWRK